MAGQPQDNPTKNHHPIDLPISPPPNTIAQPMKNSPRPKPPFYTRLPFPIGFAALLAASLTLTAAAEIPPPPATEIVIDAVVATVDDKPITLTDLSARLTPRRKLTFQQAAQDQEAQQALDAMILEKLIEEEANSRRFSASDTEVEEYVSEVAARNKLSRTEFEKALATEGKDFASYKIQVKLDILKTKLASSMTRGGVSVSDTEIDAYIADHPNFSQAGISLRLSQILVSSTGRSQDEITARLALIDAELASGKSFGEVAKQYSDSPDAADGGSLGLIAEKDLSSEIFDAVFSLKERTYSKPIATAAGRQLFFLEQRIGRKDGDSEEDIDEDEVKGALQAEVRKLLQQQKTQERLSSFFVTDLYKNHSVDKKL
jgi:peptidyl-prolyl cis-trans isomerase SurA